ncbi:hypothetical protein FisN_23Lh051 [Fistulifera solaris]|uniref:Peptide-O-fucosyltransferase n=1 Tax=Fistulifera solaris TaxID=1519565 RepID=A0A1Z5KJN5_FISSO|nr:hypothetical protein FisN_23Lh051 [Fistulifera solaris]|eukprot:GAX26524.1 hypothetical protein FisN_23Lh051 [Fistulifera solaris]
MAILVLISVISLQFFFSETDVSPIIRPQWSKEGDDHSLAKAIPLDCSQLFLYLPRDISNNGICSQLQNYILAFHVAATFHRTLIVWDPIIEPTARPVFGCSPDSEHHSTGLSQILDVPSSRRHTCASVLCPFNHSEWTRLLSSSTNDFFNLTCHGASVMVSGGRRLRRQYLQRLHETSQQKNYTQWISSIGGVTLTQIQWFQQIQEQQQDDDPWLGVAALLAPHIQWQPFLQPLIAHHLQAFHLPQSYTALHIRRGDKLKREAAAMVRKYWASRGESDPRNHSNYIPLEAYVAQLDPGKDPSHVYIATDDPVTIRDEIKQLKATPWTFHLLADRRLQSGHMNTEPDCHVRYNMTIDAMVDLEVMIRAQVFVGELNSNWGRFIHTKRTEFDSTKAVLRDFRIVSGDNHTLYLGQ